MKQDNFYRELPDGYVLVKHINAKNDKKTTRRYSIISLSIILLIFIPAIILTFSVLGGIQERHTFFAISWLIALVIYVAYIVLHELTHGITYKLMTGEKLTFGLTLTVAFCGVPKIYTKRKVALTSVIMPFAVFLPLFLGLTIAMAFVDPIIFMECAFMLGAHVGGCVGDLDVTHTLSSKLNDPDTLMRDTGPEQFFYVTEEFAKQKGLATIDISARPSADEPPAEEAATEEPPAKESSDPTNIAEE